MTNKEVIEQLLPLTKYSVDKNNIGTFPMVSTPLQVEALELAIKTLEEQERQTGEWYYNCQKGWHCSICQQTVKDMPTVMGKANFDYCPNCGVKMKQEAENE